MNPKAYHANFKKGDMYDIWFDAFDVRRSLAVIDVFPKVFKYNLDLVVATGNYSTKMLGLSIPCTFYFTRDGWLVCVDELSIQVNEECYIVGIALYTGDRLDVKSMSLDNYLYAGDYLEFMSLSVQFFISGTVALDIITTSIEVSDIFKANILSAINQWALLDNRKDKHLLMRNSPGISLV